MTARTHTFTRFTYHISCCSLLPAGTWRQVINISSLLTTMNNNNNNNHHNIYPTFKDKFGSRLISQLIGLNSFQSRLLPVNVDNNSSSIQNSDVTRFYWRTKCFSFPRATTATATESNLPSSSSSLSYGHVYFIDVTVDFIAKSTESQPCIETRFGALIKRSNDNNDEKTKSNNDCQNNSRCSYYIQTDAFTKEDLDKYAQDLRIDLNETGPIQMADIISTSLHSYNNSLSTSTEHHHYKKKFEIPPCMKLYSVQIVVPTRNDNGDQISSSADRSISRIYNNEGPNYNVDYKDRIEIYHMDLMEQGFIHFPYQNQSRQMKSVIGQTAFEMMISNIHGCDQNDMSSSSKKCNTKDNDDKTSEEILQKWWFRQQLQVEQGIDKEKIVAEDTKNCNQEELTNNYNEDDQKINDITEKDAAASSTVIIHNSASNDVNTNKKRRIVHVSNNKGQAMFCTGIQTKKKLKRGKMKIGIMK